MSKISFPTVPWKINATQSSSFTINAASIAKFELISYSNSEHSKEARAIVFFIVRNIF